MAKVELINDYMDDEYYQDTEEENDENSEEELEEKIIEEEIIMNDNIKALLDKINKNDITESKKNRNNNINENIDDKNEIIDEKNEKKNKNNKLSFIEFNKLNNSNNNNVEKKFISKRVIDLKILNNDFIVKRTFNPRKPPYKFDHSKKDEDIIDLSNLNEFPSLN